MPLGCFCPMSQYLSFKVKTNLVKRVVIHVRLRSQPREKVQRGEGAAWQHRLTAPKGGPRRYTSTSWQYTYNFGLFRTWDKSEVWDRIFRPVKSLARAVSPQVLWSEGMFWQGRHPSYTMTPSAQTEQNIPKYKNNLFPKSNVFK